MDRPGLRRQVLVRVYRRGRMGSSATLRANRRRRSAADSRSLQVLATTSLLILEWGAMTIEHDRLNEARTHKTPWKKWGPYLSERQWGTVREDYSETGDAWNYFS